MQEQEITSSGHTYELPRPFWVLATQNPIEQEGTYPLPEAQQDRFMFSIEIGYPDKDEEIEIVKSTTSLNNEKINPVVTLEEVMLFRNLVWKMPVSDSVVTTAVSLVRATRPVENECPIDVKNLLTWGAGPRASQFLILAAKAYALLDKRPTPDVEDVKKAAFAVLRHRLVRSFHAEVDNITPDDIIKRIFEFSLKKK
jgi:MoxR-like ATPase